MSNRGRNGPGPIPKRWLNCPPRSDSFICDKFIAFKTPLSDKFDDQVEGNSFYPSMLFNSVKEHSKVRSKSEIINIRVASNLFEILI